MPETQLRNIKEELLERLQNKDSQGVEKLIDELSSKEIVHLVDHLDREQQLQLLSVLSPEDAASVVEEIPEVQAADILEDLEADKAAAILHEMDSDEQADVLQEMDVDEAEAILEKLTPEEAEEVRRLAAYDYDTAGGLMRTEFISYPRHFTVQQVIDDLRQNAEAYRDYEVRYIFVTDDKGHLVGVVQMHDLLLAKPSTHLTDIIIERVLSVHHHATLQELIDFFEDYPLLGVPVVDDEGKIVGIVLRNDVLEAETERVAQEHLETQGIVGGDELRSMPVLLRARRRLSWLSVNILLNIVAASVIAYYQDVLSSVIALAVFLPIISDMSGCSGNQAVAVSMRELSLGVVRPSEVFRVWWKEVSVGLINGSALGALICLVAWLWQGNVWLGVVVGAALALNTIVAVSIGGTVPLLLKGRNVDPALASGPILTTITDMVGFFLALSFAAIMLDKIQ